MATTLAKGQLLSEAIVHKVEIFLEKREVAFLSTRKICDNLNFSTEIQILLGDKNAISPCSKNISTLQKLYNL